MGTGVAPSIQPPGNSSIFKFRACQGMEVLNSSSQPNPAGAQAGSLRYMALDNRMASNVKNWYADEVYRANFMVKPMDRLVLVS